MTKTLHDFALGGNRLGPWVIAFSERASGESAWLILGLPGAALVAGLLEMWTVVGCIAGIIFSWFVIAKPLREATAKYGALTLPELFAKRYQDPLNLIRIVSSAIITFFFTFYVAAQFSGAGKVLNVTFGINQFQGMLLGGGIIVLYTLLGGFFAVAWTDLVQGIIMICTLIVLPIVAWFELTSLPTQTTVFDWGTLFGGATGVGALAAAIGGLSWGLGYMGQPHLVVRFMAIDKAENIQTGRRIAIAWAIPAFFGAMFIGLIGKGLLLSGTLSLGGHFVHSLKELQGLVASQQVDPEKIMPALANHLIHPWLAGVFISGAIAAMMSTADSQLLVATTVLTEDVTKRFVYPQATQQLLVRISRIVTVVIGLIAFYLAWQSKSLVFETVSYAWGGLGASFGPALLLTLWWKKTSRAGVLAGMLSGTFFTVVDPFKPWITARLSAFVLAFLAVLIFSVLMPDNEETTEGSPTKA